MSDWLRGVFAADNVALFITAAIAAAAAVWQFSKQKERDRKTQVAAVYAEALQAVEDYLEAPYLVLRCDKSSRSAMQLVTDSISRVQSRIAYAQAWLGVHAPPDVSEHYDTFVRIARVEAGKAVTAAWDAPPRSSASEMPIRERLFSRDASDKARAAVVTAMRADVAAKS